jgi:TatA/E family protein of Tat protein translocase
MKTPFLALLGLNGSEYWIVLAVILLLFGAKKLPQLARGIGRSIGEFRKAKSEIDAEIKDSVK